jgi:methylamine dehydrogenase accessory protein MauD
MLDALLVSNILLWMIVVALGATALALARQVGLLHERSAPLGAMVTDKGPEIGDKAPTFEMDDFSGRPIKIGGPREAQDTLLVFLAPSCPMCNKLLPTIRALGRDEHMEVTVISDGAREDHERFLRNHHLGNIPYVVSAEIGIRYQIGKVPYAVLLDEHGVIRAKGLVNTREHLESLVEAKAMNVASLQQYLKETRAAHEDSAHHEGDHQHSGSGEPAPTSAARH